jgi:toxin FitB
MIATSGLKADEMTGYLLDTNVISETRKSNRSQNVINWLTEQEVLQLYTSEVTMAELTFGAELTEDLTKRHLLKQWIAESIRPWMHGRMLKVTENVLLRWRILSAHMKKVHRFSPETDMLIAAVAAANGLIIVTRDQSPFVLSGVPTFNPWTGERFNGA